MQSSQQLIDLIRSPRIENTRYVAYRDSGGVWTIGAGHTGPEVIEGMRIDDSQVDAYLREDLAEAEEAINRLVKCELNQHQFDALVSFVFNIGVGAFAKSTILKLLNQCDMAGAAKQFARWNKVKGRIVGGLIKRRALERRIFERGLYA
jgi:lysozyme